MFNNQYPYTDLHELNLDWFLAEFKKVTDKVTTLDATVQQFTDFVTNYFDNLDVQEEVNKKLDAMAADGSLSALIQPLFDEYKNQIDPIIAQQNENIRNHTLEIDVLEGRMDEFSSLTEGSTTGDAELMDIRVAYDGYSYPSAGDSVRQQVTDLHSILNVAVRHTKNIWPLLQDKQFTASMSVPIDLEEDEHYSISVSSIDTTATGINACRIEFFDSTDTRIPIVNESIIHPAEENYLALKMNGETPLSFTPTADITYVKLWASNIASDATGKVCTWHDVMIEKGMPATSYVYPYELNYDAANNLISSSLYGKKIVNFGDSIFGNYAAPNDISTKMKNLTTGTFYNVGFGGTRMTDNSSYGDRGYFSMCKLAEAVASGSFTDQESALNNISDPDLLYRNNLTLLESIDFSTIDIVTIEQCTNDWYGNTNLTGDPDNHLVFESALKYVIDTMMTAYPNLNIVIIGPIYRWFSASSDSNNYQNTKGDTLIAYKNKMKEIADQYNCKFIDDYYIGINKYNHAKYLTDGTHPTDAGINLIAANIAMHLL